eukprot:XP_010664937.2 PREDICTED: uncharacterized protein LOC104882605 [Vitis vinifera]
MKMGTSFAAPGFILLLTACMVAVSEADTIVVGGSEHWHYGFNYTYWSIQHGPFFINDKLVFKYNPPSKNYPRHSVYLLPNLWSFVTCDFSQAKLLANPQQGGGKGFVFELTNWRPHYFASGEEDGSQCGDGRMKFFAVPLPRWGK